MPHLFQASFFSTPPRVCWLERRISGHAWNLPIDLARHLFALSWIPFTSLRKKSFTSSGGSEAAGVFQGPQGRPTAPSLRFGGSRIMDHPALGVIIPGLVEAACQTALEARVSRSVVLCWVGTPWYPLANSKVPLGKKGVLTLGNS